MYRISSTEALKDAKVVETSESKENYPPKLRNASNGGSKKIDAVNIAGVSQNGHLHHTKKEQYTQSNNTVFNTLMLDYPELRSYNNADSNIMRGKSSSGPENVVSQGSELSVGGLNGLSPLNKSQIISRRLKLDLRNESEIPIAGKIFVQL